MPTYAEEYNNRISDLDSVYINVNYYPIPDSKFIVFPSGTEVIGFKRFGKKFLIFKSPYSYFNVLLHQMMLLLSNLESQKDIDEDLLDNVTTGYRLVCKIFRKCDLINLKYEQMEKCLNILDKLVNILNQEHFRNFALMKMFFEIVTAVSVSECLLKVDIYNTSILPKLLKFEVKVEHLFQRDILSPGILMTYLVAEEQSDMHDLLLLYIEFITNAMKVMYFLFSCTVILSSCFVYRKMNITLRYKYQG